MEIKRIIDVVREQYIKANCFKFLTFLSPKLNTKVVYYDRLHKRVNLKNPQNLNEKIQWMKLYYYPKNDLVIQCADKLRVRDYVIDCGCEEILNELYSVYDDVSEIDWKKLPNQFVIKSNTGCGCNFVCHDKSQFDEHQVIKRIKKWKKRKEWLVHSEMHYDKIPRKLICEKYLNDGTGLQPIDYKIYCFGGKPLYIMACIGREKGHPKFYIFDRNWNIMPFNKTGKEAPKDLKISRPQCLDELFKYAEILSKPFPFVRADFYDINGKAIFGELTFTPCAGLDAGRLPETDLYFGSLVNLPQKRRK